MERKKLQFPSKYYFKGIVSWRGGFELVKHRFSVLGFESRMKATQFWSIYNGPSLQFSGNILHELLYIRTDIQDPNSVTILVNGNELCFGIKEFAIITGLNFGTFPVDKHVADDWSSPLFASYFPDHVKTQTKVKLSELKLAFDECDDLEDSWKLGLVFFVCKCFYGYEKDHRLDNKLFNLVDDVDAFIKYPWGKVAWRSTLSGLRKNLKTYVDSVKPIVDLKSQRLVPCSKKNNTKEEDSNFISKGDPICEMIPFLQLQEMTSETYKARYPEGQPKVPLAWEKLGEDVVPKANNSGGDCGMFTIMYLEYILAGFQVSEVKDEHMEHWRKLWADRIFHHEIEP